MCYCECLVEDLFIENCGPNFVENITMCFFVPLQIFVGSGRQFSGSKVEFKYSAEDTCRTFSIGDI